MLENSIEIKFERTKESLEKIGLMKELGNSMLLEPGRKVGYVKHESGKKYEVGDIIVYRLESGVNVYHVVVSYEDKGDTRVYRTQGINNKYADLDRVYDHQLIGQVVKFSESELAFLIEMAEQGRIPYIEGLGMTKETELILDIAQIFSDYSGNDDFISGKDAPTIISHFSEFITSQITDSAESNYFSDLTSQDLNKQEKATKIINLMHKILKLDNGKIRSFNGFRDLTVFQGQELLNRIKSASLMKCVDYFKSEILSDYTTELFNEFVRLNPSTINSRQLISVLDTLSHIDQFHREEKAQVDLEISIENGILDINKFTQKIWDKSYTELLKNSVMDSRFMNQEFIDQLEGSENLYGDIIEVFSSTLLGITVGPEIEGMDIYTLYFGNHNYDTNGGSGLEHIIQQHLENQFENWGYDSSKKVYKFLLETLRDNKNYKFQPDSHKKGGSLIYKVVDEYGNNQILKIIISRYRFIVTAYPLNYNRGLKLYNQLN